MAACVSAQPTNATLEQVKIAVTVAPDGSGVIFRPAFWA